MIGPRGRSALRLAVPVVLAATMSIVGMGSSASGAATASQAKSAVAKYEVRPTAIPITTPVGKPIPTGKTVDYINCGVAACVAIGQILTEGDNTLGWHTNSISTDGSAQATSNAWTQILREKPDAVVYVGLPTASIQSSLLQAQQDGIKVAACCVSDPVGNGLDYENEGKTSGIVDAPVFADWILATSSTPNPGVLYVNLPSQPDLVALAAAYDKDMKAKCPNCPVDTLNVAETAIGTTEPTEIVSYLRAHPSITHVILATDSLGIGVPAAIKAAGLKNINVFGEGPTTTNLEYIATGGENGTVMYPYYESTLAITDALARMFVGDKLLPPISVRPWIITKANLPSSTTLFPIVPNVLTQFEKLWGKES